MANFNENQKCEIWIETAKDRNGKRILHIGSKWGCNDGFDKNTTKKLFAAISKAVITVIPNAEINPWKNNEHGIPDFDLEF